MTSSATSPSQKLSFGAMQEIVAECLCLEIAEVTPTARFFNDLGGESIDLLELSFLFEKKFQIRAPFGSFNRKELWERDENGQLTPAAQDLMRRDFAYLDIDQRLATAESSNPRDMLTTEVIFFMLQHAAAASSGIVENLPDHKTQVPC